MSIQSELSRLSNAKSEIKAAIESKGVQVPNSATLDEYGNLIRQIPGIECQHPVGFIFEWSKVAGQSVDLSTPEKVAQYFGYGTWAEFAPGKVLAAVNDYHAIGTSVGEESHAITLDEMPSHEHGLSAWSIGTADVGSSTGLSTNAYPPTYDNFTPTTKAVGGGQPISLMQPTQYVYRWQRIA